jgi:hypothetical protein
MAVHKKLISFHIFITIDMLILIFLTSKQFMHYGQNDISNVTRSPCSSLFDIDEFPEDDQRRQLQNSINLIWMKHFLLDLQVRATA